MTSEEWLLLADSCIEEHERIWKSAVSIEQKKFALQLQSYALIAGTMAKKIKELRK